MIGTGIVYVIVMTFSSNRHKGKSSEKIMYKEKISVTKKQITGNVRGKKMAEGCGQEPPPNIAHE